MRSAEDLIEGLLSQEPPEDRAGMALCLLAIDLHRVSGTPVAEKSLRDLLPRYLGTDEAEDAVFTAALAWATRQVPGTNVILLRPTTQPDRTRAWEVHPALIAADSRRSRPIHGAVVEMLAFRAVALLRQESEEVAVEYLRAAAQAHPSAARAAAFIGDSFLKLGELATGSPFLMIVVEHGEPELAAPIAGMLAQELHDTGDLEAASAVMRRLVDMNLPMYLPRAAFTLAGWLTRLGRPEEACQYFQRAVESGDPEYMARAAVPLGALLMRQGRLAEAAEAVRAAAQGDGQHSVQAAALLGEALSRLGDLQGAELAYGKVVASGNSELAPGASYALSNVRARRGDTRGAVEALRFVVQSSDPLAAEAGVWLGRLLQELGDRAGAQRAWERAIETGHPEHAPKAAYSLGVQAEESGDHKMAADAFARAIDTASPEDTRILPGAALSMAKILYAHREQYPRILHDAPERAAEYAVFGLATMLEQREVDAAMQVCELAIASGRTRPAREGATVLARLIRTYEDIPNSKEALALVRTAHTTQPAGKANRHFDTNP
jgi:tetratricopeptide (TPR) repeat protein